MCNPFVALNLKFGACVAAGALLAVAEYLEDSAFLIVDLKRREISQNEVSKATKYSHCQ
jgi:hypothetical protein